MTSFTPTDRVKVVAGPHAGDVGTVVELPSLGGVRVHRDGKPAGDWDRYWPDEITLDLATEGVKALTGDVDGPELVESGRPLPRRTPRVTLGQIWAAQAAVRAPEDAPIAYVPVYPAPTLSSDGVTLSFGGVA